MRLLACGVLPIAFLSVLANIFRIEIPGMLIFLVWMIGMPCAIAYVHLSWKPKRQLEQGDYDCVDRP